MGWAFCGNDSKGRPIGYGVEATCDEPGCTEEIDRGVSYACGGMHGADSSCEGYFCGKHLFTPGLEDDEYEWAQENSTWSGDRLCRTCCADIEKWVAEEMPDSARVETAP